MTYSAPHPERPSWQLRTRELLVLVIVTNVLGNIALSHGMHKNGAVVSISPLAYLQPLANPWVIAGIAVLIVWMISDLALLSRADLSFVLPVTSVSYVLIAILGQTVLQERISASRWAGILLITLGVIVVGLTPARTTEEHPMEDDQP